MELILIKPGVGFYLKDLTMIDTPELYCVINEKHLGLKYDQLITKCCIERKRLDIDRHLLDAEEICGVAMPGDLVIDIGSFIGTTVRMWLDRGCKVYAFEPQMDAYKCLISNCPEAICIPAVVGDGVERMLPQLLPPDDNNLGSRTTNRHTNGFLSLAIDSVIFPHPVKLMKIDVEGNEPLVLKGCVETINTHQPVLVIEVNRPALHLQGYTEENIFNALSGYSFRPIQPEREGTDLPWDVLCLPKGFK